MIADFHIDKGLVLEFFCVFLQFEYALKRTGFATENGGRVDADWECFGKTVLRRNSM